MRQVASKGLDSFPRRVAVFIEPMDCAPVSKLPDGLQWVFEIKLCGYPAVAVKSDRGVNLTPAMAAGATDHFWDASELVTLLETEEMAERAG